MRKGAVLLTMAFYTSATNWIKKNKILFLLFLLGLTIRLLGTNPGLHAHGDEVMYGQVRNMFLNKTLGMQRQLLGYPPLVAWIMLVSFIVIFIPVSFLILFIKKIKYFVLIF